MCCDLFSQYVWVCIFVCCVFTSFRPGEGAELAKPPLLISLRSGASSQTSECRLQHSHSVFLMTSHCQMKHSRVTLFCSSRAESCAYLFCQLPLTPNQKYTGLCCQSIKRHVLYSQTPVIWLEMQLSSRCPCAEAARGRKRTSKLHIETARIKPWWYEMPVVTTVTLSHTNREELIHAH